MSQTARDLFDKLKRGHYASANAFLTELNTCTTPTRDVIINDLFEQGLQHLTDTVSKQIVDYLIN